MHPWTIGALSNYCIMVGQGPTLALSMETNNWALVSPNTPSLYMPETIRNLHTIPSSWESKAWMYPRLHMCCMVPKSPFVSREYSTWMHPSQ